MSRTTEPFLLTHQIGVAPCRRVVTCCWRMLNRRRRLPPQVNSMKTRCTQLKTRTPWFFFFFCFDWPEWPQTSNRILVDLYAYCNFFREYAPDLCRRRRRHHRQNRTNPPKRDGNNTEGWRFLQIFFLFSTKMPSQWKEMTGQIRQTGKKILGIFYEILRVSAGIPWKNSPSECLLLLLLHHHHNRHHRLLPFVFSLS